MSDEPTSYEAAVGELDTILAAIEASDVDVDTLAGKVARAAELIEWCRSRLIVAREAIEEATDRLPER